MTAPVGHEKCRAALEAELPSQPVLLLGPESTGKWPLAVHLAGCHAQWFDLRADPAPRMERIRDLRRFLSTQPRGPVKVVALNLDGAAAAAVQNALLKELEEPPEYARFLLVASKSPLPTISSRCVTWRLGHLTDAQVAEVLVSQGIIPKDAGAIAPIGHGQVGAALAAAERFRPAKAAVTGVVRAIAARDKDTLERVVKDWGETEDWMLRELLGAAASGRPTPLFSPAERMLIGRSVARHGIALLAASGRARPQVAVRAMAGTLMEAR